MPRASNPVLPQPVFHEPIFSEDRPSLDPSGFLIKHPSDNNLYTQIQKLLTKDVVGFEKSRNPDDELYSLEDALGARGPDVTKTIKSTGKIIFHTVGDSGASNAGKYNNEISVADQLTMDCHTSDESNQPAFLFHKGDVVYNFGESKYYYDQFFEPFRNYPAPIFAIPGNHDSFVIPGTPVDDVPLAVFQRNFCSEERVVTREAASLHRTAMTQPGVYYTLDAPFVRIIGLFSNALEDPGVISSENGRWPNVPDFQLTFLTAQLKRIKEEKYKGALLLAVHHPPFSYSPPKKNGAGGNHGSSLTMIRQIDEICDSQGIYPHAFLSGHAHNYQRYTRTVKIGGRECEVPFIVCGDGGHNVNRLVQSRGGHFAQEPHYGTDVSYLDIKAAIKTSGLLLEKYNDGSYGYLRIHVDSEQLRIAFQVVGSKSIQQSRFDLVTVELATHSIVAN